MMFPKQKWKKKRKKHRKSILQLKEDRRCYLCALEGNLQEQSYLEEHHVMFGEGLRQLSEEYGLKVNLCTRHHRTGKEAVHNNKENADKLKKIAQERFEEVYPDLDWMEIFRRNYKEGMEYK